MASWGVLKPEAQSELPSFGASTKRDNAGRTLTESNLFVESNTAGRLFGQEFFRVKENAFLLLESSLSLHA